MARLIGTAGHVDHGKTSLIRALTGIDADRLPEEKKRGLTIDIGFAYLDLPDIGRVSIVDVPGHEKFVSNMLVGALGMDLALLCVAADESVMPQTREHFQILTLLPVERMVVALTRSDAADDVSQQIAAEEVAELFAGTRFAGSPIVVTSATTGEGLDELRVVLAAALQAADPQVRGPWYLPIDRVFTVKGHGAVITGSLVQGEVKEGGQVAIEPGGLEARIRSVQSHEEPLASAGRGRRVALNLSGVRAEALSRGQIAAEPGTVFATDRLDAEVTWLKMPKHGARVRLSLGADEAIARAFHSDADPSIVQLRLERPTAAVKGQPLILRNYSPPSLLGGGRVVVPQAGKRKKSESAGAVKSPVAEDDAALAIILANENGVPTEEICRRMGRTPQALGPVLESLLKSGRALSFAGLWLTPETFTIASARFLAALERLHESNAALSMITREKVAAEAGIKWSGKPLDRIVAQLAQAGRIRVGTTGIALPEFKVRLGDRQRALLDRVKEQLDQAGPNVPGHQEIAIALSVPHQAVTEITKVGLEAGELVWVGEGLVYTVGAIENLKDAIRKEFPRRPFSASEFRERMGTTRKYAIPILEYMDSKGVTVRQGDVRTLR